MCIGVCVKVLFEFMNGNNSDRRAEMQEKSVINILLYSYSMPQLPYDIRI